MRDAAVHAEDRGFQFADAVYEVCEVKGGRLVDETRHMQRLRRSLGELRIPQPMTHGAWSRVLRETIRRNRVADGIVYLQVSRGAGPRDFLFPSDAVLPTVVCLARSVLAAAARSGGGDRHRGQDHARHALGALRHQDRDAAAGGAGQGSGARRTAPRKPGSSTRRAT